jgi:predicted GIY-YIG superfamily endonuclease
MFPHIHRYFYLIKTKTLIRDEDLIYIGITTNPENRYHDHMGSGSTSILKNYTKGVLEYNVFDIKLEKMRRQYAENLETLLACILKYNYPNLKIYGGCFNRIDCYITNDKIIEKFKDVFKGKYDAIFYKNFNEFIKIVIGKNRKTIHQDFR